MRLRRKELLPGLLIGRVNAELGVLMSWNMQMRPQFERLISPTTAKTGLGEFLTKGFAKRFGIVALITQDIVCGQVGDEGFGLGDVARLSRRQDEA